MGQRFASQPVPPGQRAVLVVPFPVEKRAVGVYMDCPTGERFVIERIDKLSTLELAEHVAGGVYLVGTNGGARHGLRITVHYRESPDGAPATFHGEVDLEVDAGALERHLGFVVERGMRDARDEAARKKLT